jgi:dipeptidase D
MNEAVRALEPSSLWNHFADLNAVPRASKKEAAVIAFMQAFGEKLGLPVDTDASGNVVMRKPASPGYEDRPVVCLQSHLDMVHQKNAGTLFDFDTQGIDMFVEDDWVKAKGTTLGADNGIGVATIMALLASTDIPHPPLEALFTIDEETGMTGAFGLEPGRLQASILLNLDTEEDNELTIGCAGGIDVTATGTYTPEALPAGHETFRIEIKGLTGGHSGMDIHRGRGNANLLMIRLLDAAMRHCGARLANFDGGSLRNAIPREAVALVTVEASQAQHLNDITTKVAAELHAEHAHTDPNLSVHCAAADAAENMVPEAFSTLFVRLLSVCPNGIARMSPDIEGLVQTSNNVARVWMRGGEYSIQCLTRSAVESEKFDLARRIGNLFYALGAGVTEAGSYPGWTPKPEAGIVQLMSSLYRELHHGEEAHVNACHAGLECGILGRNYPGMEMISFGPTIRGAHSPDERVSVSSVQKFWSFLLHTLRAIPAAAKH